MPKSKWFGPGKLCDWCGSNIFIVSSLGYAYCWGCGRLYRKRSPKDRDEGILDRGSEAVAERGDES